MVRVRKQFLITEGENDKLKRLAAHRGCTQAELIRLGIRMLPEFDDEVTRRLRERGMLVERPHDGPLMSDGEREALQAALDARLKARGAKPRLSQAIIEDREERDAFLAGVPPWSGSQE
jgi:hypothetical protein